MEAIRHACTPNKTVSKQVVAGIVLFWIVTFLVFWTVAAPKIIPRPFEVLGSFAPLWKQGIIVELWRSFATNVKALFLASVISLGLSYLTVLPAVRPLVEAIAKMRFLGLTGLTLIFTLTVGGGEWLKVVLLSFGMTVFYVTYMASVVASIPRETFDHARTLRMSEWRIVWEVVILGKMDEAFEALRQNAAIGWMMLTMVEGMVRSGGGIGTMLLSQNKYFNLGAVFAIQILILVIGIGQDWLIGTLKNMVCPYANLTLERK
jgi:NitT/TauT family transport system permease protein